MRRSSVSLSPLIPTFMITGNASVSTEARSNTPQDVRTWGGAVSVVQSPATPTTSFINTLRQGEEEQAKSHAQGEDSWLTGCFKMPVIRDH